MSLWNWIFHALEKMADVLEEVSSGDEADYEEDKNENEGNERLDLLGFYPHCVVQFAFRKWSSCDDQNCQLPEFRNLSIYIFVLKSHRYLA